MANGYRKDDIRRTNTPFLLPFTPVSLPRKIVIIGPESTGKSTLCSALAEWTREPWVPEFARGFLEGLDRPYKEPDLLDIAIGQLESEDRLYSTAQDILLCDTDLHVLKTWSHERYGRCHRLILEAVATRNYDAYLLTYPDLPWTADPQREHPDPADRLRLWRHYHDAVQATGLPWIDIRGQHEIRLQHAMSFIGTLLKG